MTGQTFQRSVQQFVDTLNGIVADSLDTDGRFAAEVARDGEQAFVEVSKIGSARPPGLPLLRSLDDPEVPVLFLHAQYTVETGTASDHLRVRSSSVGLWGDVTGGRKRPRPIVRVEYDRGRLRPGMAASHVHLHANSPELAWIYGSSAQAAPDLHALHFPAGGRRFRPTLEEFLLFLDRERLFTDWRDGWKSTLIRSLEAWERLQARATARQFPGEAADALEALGYNVMPPGGVCPRD